MDKEQIEKELNEMFGKTKKLIDDAYVCGYKDGYYECMIHKYKPLDEPKRSNIQISMTDM